MLPTQFLYLWSDPYQFFGQVFVILKSFPELLQHFLKCVKVRVWFELIKQRGVAKDGIMETSNSIHIHVILPRRDGRQVNKHLQLIDI